MSCLEIEVSLIRGVLFREVPLYTVLGECSMTKRERECVYCGLFGHYCMYLNWPLNQPWE